MPHDTNLDGTLQLDEQNDRYASPLILKPLACQKGAVGLAAILQGPEVPDELYIKGPFRDPTIRRTLSEDQAADIPPLDGNPDVLQAFLDYLNK
jgi:CRISPR-associated protein Cmr1